MRLKINKVRNTFDGKKGLKLQLMYNDNKTRTFRIFRGFRNSKKISILDTDNSLLLANENSNSTIDYTFEKATETKNILIQSINFVKEKIRKMILLNEFDYVIENEYGYIKLLDEILYNVNNKLVSFNTPKAVLLYNKG